MLNLTDIFNIILSAWFAFLCRYIGIDNETFYIVNSILEGLKWLVCNLFYYQSFKFGKLCKIIDKSAKLDFLSTK